MAKVFRGLGHKDEINAQLDRRDVRPFREKFQDLLETKQFLTVFLFTTLGSLFILPQYIEVISLFALVFFYWVRQQKFSLSFRLPITSRLLDYNDLQPGSGKPSIASGIAFLGNEIGTNRELWFNKSDMCTHVLVFGSTGAGKALRDQENVLTPSGWKKMKDLHVGDDIFTPDRQITKVTDIFPQGPLDLWTVVFEDGRELDVSLDHLWGVAACHNTVSLTPQEQPLHVTDVLSTDELEHELFYRTLPENQYYAIPLTEAVGDTVFIPTENSEYYEHLIELSLKNEGIFPEEYIQGSVKQRESLWYKLKKHARAVGPTYFFDSLNKQALQSIQQLCWSLGLWAKLEFWNDSFSLSVQTHVKWLKIVSIHKSYKEEPCRCIKIADPHGLFITKNWIVTHNTEALISMAFNTLVTGSGFIYVDGKGDNGLWAKIFAVVRYLGREDDLLLINFMTGGTDMSGPQKTKASNSMNPFIVGSAAGLTELLVGLMDEAGGDNAMWKGRAISLISSIMLALVYLRDHDGLLLGVETIRDHLLLEKIQQLSKRRDLPAHVIQSLKSYLRSLPGYQDSAPKQSETVMDQHGYLQMQFTRILGSLADIYGYIFKTNLGEVDFFDVVLNRRILVVLLPAMEKSTDELANLGKIIVACLKQMMATGLGNIVEGDYVDVIETKPTTSPAPYMCILDEYGYYVVKGASVMPAQARSLGFCMVFAGQDYPAFKKNNNAEEAVSTIGNCNIKIFMKLEDPTETYKLAEDSIGKGNVGTTAGLSRNNGISSGYIDQQNANIQRRERVDWLDFKDHGAGEAHIIFKSTLVRANMFFAAAPKIKQLQVNSLLAVEPPHHTEIEEFDEYLDDLKQKILSQTQIQDMVSDSLENIPVRLKIIQNVFQQHSEAYSAGLVALSSLYAVSQQSAQNMGEKTRQFSLESLSELDNDKNLTDEKDKLHIFRDDLEEDEQEDEDEEETSNIWKQIKPQKYQNDENDDDDDDDMFSEEDNDDFGDDDDEDEDEQILLNEHHFKRGIERIEQGMGITKEEAKERSETITEDMKIVSSYPKTPPEPVDTDEFSDFLEELEAKLDPNTEQD